jgi:hypothetical protein
MATISRSRSIFGASGEEAEGPSTLGLARVFGDYACSIRTPTGNFPNSLLTGRAGAYIRPHPKREAGSGGVRARLGPFAFEMTRVRMGRPPPDASLT